jgi:hypothetical protein
VDMDSRPLNGIDITVPNCAPINGVQCKLKSTVSYLRAFFVFSLSTKKYSIELIHIGKRHKIIRLNIPLLAFNSNRL